MSLIYLLVLLVLLLIIWSIKKCLFAERLQSENRMELKHQIPSVILMFIGAMLPLTCNWFLHNYGARQDGEFLLLISKTIDSVILLSFFTSVLLPSILFGGILLCLFRFFVKWINRDKTFTTFLSVQRFSNMLFLFSEVYAVISILACFSAFKVLQFTDKSNEGYILGSIINGLALPNISPFLFAIYGLLLTGIIMLILVLLDLSVKRIPIPYVGKKNKIFQVILTVLSLILIFFAFLMPFISSWVIRTFGTISAEQLFFQLRVPMKGTNSDFYVSFLVQCLVPALFLLFIALLCIHPYLKNHIKYHISIRPVRKQIKLLLVPRWIIIFLMLFIPCPIIFISISDFSQTIGLESYLKNIMSGTSFVDENYVDPYKVNLSFPEKKRNLIYIFMESMENSYMSLDQGGAQQKNLIPELTQIAQDNISFSNTNTFGGAMQLNASSWTIAGMVGQHMVLPLQLPIQGNSYDQFESFLPGAYGLGDILQEQGYVQTLLVGSDAEFGGRKAYYTQHGGFKVLDLFTAWTDRIVPNGRKVWWGFEDTHLYDYAKKELAQLAAQEQPFHLTMLTVDTHHVGGYYCSFCKNENQDQYWNVISCASSQLNHFLNWLKMQPYYDNTTIIIAGDHLSMDTIVPQQAPSGYIRTTYNAFINSAVPAKNTKNRKFATIDMFPSILASMGVEIPGNRLALGTNLFSGQKTLLEQYGYEEVNSGMSGYSKIYNSLLTKDK